MHLLPPASWAAIRLGLEPGQIVYVGDDDIDAAAIRSAGIGVSVPAAMPSALAADYLTAAFTEYKAPA